MSRRALIGLGAVCLTLLIAACSNDPSTAPTRYSVTPATHAAVDRDGACASDEMSAIIAVDCDSTSGITSRSGYLVAAGRK